MDQTLRLNLVPKWQAWGLLLRQLCLAAVHDSEGVLENITPDSALCQQQASCAAWEGGQTATLVLEMSVVSPFHPRLIHYGSIGSHQ